MEWSLFIVLWLIHFLVGRQLCVCVCVCVCVYMCSLPHTSIRLPNKCYLAKQFPF